MIERLAPRWLDCIWICYVFNPRSRFPDDGFGAFDATGGHFPKVNLGRSPGGGGNFGGGKISVIAPVESLTGSNGGENFVARSPLDGNSQFGSPP